jgi:hypothetical protein
MFSIVLSFPESELRFSEFYLLDGSGRLAVGQLVFPEGGGASLRYQASNHSGRPIQYEVRRQIDDGVILQVDVFELPGYGDMQREITLPQLAAGVHHLVLELQEADRPENTYQLTFWITIQPQVSEEEESLAGTGG